MKASNSCKIQVLNQEVSLLFCSISCLVLFHCRRLSGNGKKTFNSASSATRANLPEADKAGGDIKEYFQQKDKNEIKKWTLQIFQTSNWPGSV